MQTARQSFPYIPSYLEDELLFSWISRLHLLNSEVDSRRTLLKLFGSGSGIPSADLPCRLGEFFGHAGAWLPFESVDALARSSTLLPYYGFFLDAPRYQKTVDCMVGRNAMGLKVSLGLVANRFGASMRFRACKSCDVISQKDFGCTALRRIHQLPAVLVCPIHGEALSESAVQSGQSHRQRLCVPHMTDVQEGMRQQATGCLLSIAALSKETLTLQSPRLSNNARKAVYHQGLKLSGLERQGRVKWDELSDLILRRYNGFTDTPFQSRLMATRPQPMLWVHDLCSRQERNLHPLCHLLFIGCIFGSVRAFIEVAENFQHSNFGSGLKPDLLSTGDASVDELSAMLSNRCLSCRYIAKSTGLSTTTIVARRRALGIPISERRKTITVQKSDHAQRMLTEGQPIAKIAEQTQLSKSSIYRILATSTSILETRKARSTHETRNFHRFRWLQVSSENHTASVTVLRRTAASTYQWLYRHDPTWLARRLPGVIVGPARAAPSYINWPDRDQRLTYLVTQEVARLRKGANRVSMTSLLRATGQESSIRKNLSRLPMLARALLNLVEDDHAFCERRRKMALARLSLQGHTEPEEWRIQRSAGIRERCGPK